MNLSTDWWNLHWVTSPLWLLLNALVAFRLTRLITVDMLPPLPTVRERVERWAYRRWERKVGPEPDPGAVVTAGDRVWQRYGGVPPLAYLITCPWCAGFWVSLAVTLTATLVPSVAWVFIAVPLAFSAVTGLLHAVAE